MIDTPEREAVDHLLSMQGYVDVIIPRGGKNLIEKPIYIDFYADW